MPTDCHLHTFLLSVSQHHIFIHPWSLSFIQALIIRAAVIRNKIFIKVRRTFPRIPGMFPEFQGHSQNSRDVSRIPGMFPEFQGHSQNSRDVSRIPGMFPEFRGHSQNSRDVSGIPGMFQEFHGCSISKGELK